MWNFYYALFFIDLFIFPTKIFLCKIYKTNVVKYIKQIRLFKNLNYWYNFILFFSKMSQATSKNTKTLILK